MQITHAFNSVNIAQRSIDGYIDATAMCRANGKLFADYYRLRTTRDFLAALAIDMGIPISALVQGSRGGETDLQGTWVDPYVVLLCGGESRSVV